MIPYGIAISAILHTNPGRFTHQSCQDCFHIPTYILST